MWVASPWEHVLKDTKPGDGEKVNLQCAANEYEIFRVIVSAGDKPLTNCRARVCDLVSENGAIPASNISLYRAHYIHIFEPSYRSTAPPGWYPDPLIPVVDPETGKVLAGAQYDAQPFDVPPNTNQQIWGEVYVPKGTSAGDYSGQLVVTSGGRRLAEVPIRLTVWDFELPDEIAMRSNFGSLGGVANYLKMNPTSEQFRPIWEAYILTLLQHRAIPSSLGGVWPDWSEEGGIDDTQSGQRLHEMVYEHHVNALRIPFRYRDNPPKCKAYLSDLANYLRQRGLLDIAYIYLKDEPNNAEDYQIVRDQAALIHEADPDIKCMCTEQTKTSNPEWGDLYGAVDIWCPLWGLWDQPTAQQRLQMGEELWSYTALCQGPDGTPWWQIDFPPLNFRAPFWISWHYSITGFLYWSSVYWNYEDVWNKPHFRDRYWGEGMLLYPGQPAGIKGPVVSIRLKLIREALEDYEYMNMAAKLPGGNEYVDQVVAQVATSFQDWSRQLTDYQRARQALAQFIQTSK